MNTTSTTEASDQSADKRIATLTTSKPGLSEYTHEGKIFSITGNKLVSSSADGK